jgi:pilus assembly protein CpaC
VADVVNISKTELSIDPKAAGSTTLIIWDNFGEQSYRLNVFTEDMSIIKRRVDNMLSSLNLPGVYTKAEDEEAKVLLLGTVKSAKDKGRITAALDQIKDKIIDLVMVKEEESLIEIDVQVIEINKGSQDVLGFTWPGSVNLTEVGSPGIQAAGTTWGKLFKVANETRAAFTLKLDALIQEGKARILSRPRVSCQSGKEAKLVVGGEVPVLSGTVSPGGTTGTPGATTSGSVEYKEYGIILNVKPLLEDNGRIHLGLDVTVSEVGDQVQTDYALAYRMTKRTATTELLLDDGQTMAIGGLIKQKKSEDVRRVPWLSNIPVVGAIFKQRTKASGWDSDLSEINDIELFITLTPRVVSQIKPQEESRPKIAKITAPNYDNIKDPVLRYSKLVQQKVLNALVYPPAAKAAGFQGTVKLSLKLSPQGELLESKLKETSSYRVLDDAALQKAQDTSPYPPFPPDIKEQEIWVDIPITYQLE